MKAELSISQQATNLKWGIYQHYKGPEYEVLGVVRHSETLEEMVYYKKLEDGGLWVRPFGMFVEDVIVNGKGIPRFKYLNK